MSCNYVLEIVHSCVHHRFLVEEVELVLFFKMTFLSPTISSNSYGCSDVIITKIAQAHPLYSFLMYHLPGCAASFSLKLQDWSSSTVKIGRIIIVGDFKIQDDLLNNASKAFMSIMDFNLSSMYLGTLTLLVTFWIWLLLVVLLLTI